MSRTKKFTACIAAVIVATPHVALGQSFAPGATSDTSSTPNFQFVEDTTAPQSRATEFVFTDAADGTEFNFTEERKTTRSADFTFNGGAGSDGETTFTGGYSETNGNAEQFANGNGNAYLDNAGDAFVAASFEAGSESFIGGFATDKNSSGPSALSFEGLVTSGGAGGVSIIDQLDTEYRYEPKEFSSVANN